MREVSTQSGTVYLLDDEASTVVRLVDHNGALRRDGETIRLLGPVESVVGEPMVMLLDLRLDGVVTVRMTTPVVEVVTPVTEGISQ